MLLHPYQTTIAQQYPVTKIRRALSRAHIDTPLPNVETPTGQVFPNIHMVTPVEAYQDVPSFTQPISIQLPNGKPGWVFDARTLLRVDRRTGAINYTAINDFTFQTTRTVLTDYVVRMGPQALIRLGNYPVEVFVRWLTQALTQRLNLDLVHQQNVSIITAFYYFQLLAEDPVQEHHHRDRFAQRIAQITRSQAGVCLEVLDQLPVMQTGNDYVAALKAASGSLRLDSLGFSDLYTMVAMSWVGVNARENVGVALEHPPTFLAMVFSALRERSYRKTLIAQRAEKTGRRNEQQGFSHGIEQLIDKALK